MNAKTKAARAEMLRRAEAMLKAAADSPERLRLSDVPRVVAMCETAGPAWVFAMRELLRLRNSAAFALFKASA